jgi:phospholipase C
MSAPDTGSGPADATLQQNNVTITDRTGTILSITFVPMTSVPPPPPNQQSPSLKNGVIISSGQPCNAPASNAWSSTNLKQDGNLFSFTLWAGRSKTTPVATAFDTLTGGGSNEYAPQGGGSSGPSQLNFFFEIQIVFQAPTEQQTVTIYLGQGSYSGGNNWWVGGSCVSYINNQPFLLCPGLPALALSGLGSSDYEFVINFPIKHVFVLMLENHSFDNIFAFSGISGIFAATDQNNAGYPVFSPALTSMPADPGHEFLDVLEQLAGLGATYPSGGNYPTPLTNSGFVNDYINTGATDYGDIMAGFETQTQLPVIYQLATEFAICDQWFSSLPGPTWPNRYFVHGASSAGLDDSPTSSQIKTWESTGCFEYPRGSIYDALQPPLGWRLYRDTNGPLLGSIPQVASIHNINLVLDVNPLNQFVTDLYSFGGANYTYQYTFIEPNYGAVTTTYEGGTSQHPMDGVSGGEGLIKMVYEAIRNSPIWNSSLLIITYDEHGGFYDHCIPGPATAPNDGSSSALSLHGFTFEQLGVRVPAVIVSPYIPAGTVDHTAYDHASVLATVEKLFNLGPLTQRDASANNVIHLLSSTFRTDCPTTLNDPATVAAKPALTSDEQAAIDQEPLPEKGNMIGFLGVALKTDLELSSGSATDKAAIMANVNAIKTKGDAKAYMTSVMNKVKAARAAAGKPTGD